ncbi:hypothetical protein IEQ34_005834 [Dendrobium chrysotoxum]|uniref:Large ribosomal subunit protein uL10-like insertion domain-containing protein n=1 Tax=Dendrobium chrysotoxum TaxID=161865 RepID=A0AAV7HA00_DENCH|nr:hypothetical protein IEQ34_005834 [Dendrobium chrysotoxum]
MKACYIRYMLDMDMSPIRVGRLNAGSRARWLAGSEHGRASSGRASKQRAREQRARGRANSERGRVRARVGHGGQAFKQVKMTVKLSKAEKKVKYDKKLCRMLDKYSKVLIALADNVGSNQLQNIRKGLRGDSIVLMGKNTLIRRCIKMHAEKRGNQAYLSLLPFLVVKMTVKLFKAEKKVKYDKMLCRMLDEYNKVLIALADNNIRKGLRGDSIVLMGKNTLIRRCIKMHAEKSGNQAYLSLLSLLVVKMTVKLSKAEKKVKCDKKLCRMLDEYNKVQIALADNNIRKGLRGDSIVLMGKNTLIRRCIKMHAKKSGNQAYLSLLPLLVGNVGLIFTKGDLKEVSEEVAKYKVGAPARVGLVDPIDVVPPGNTGLDPSQTSFFQVLNIPTKINKGTVEIITPVELIKKGDKVGSSEAALLAKLGIRPFSYGLVVQSVYEDGSVFSPEVLDLTEDDLIEKFSAGLSMVTSLSLAISYPTLAAAPHMFINAYKNVLAVAIATDYTYPQAEKVKEYLKDPSKFAVSAAPAASVTPAASTAPAAAVEEKKSRLRNLMKTWVSACSTKLCWPSRNQNSLVRCETMLFFKTVFQNFELLNLFC